jgi:hypothetical protein
MVLTVAGLIATTLAAAPGHAEGMHGGGGGWGPPPHHGGGGWGPHGAGGGGWERRHSGRSVYPGVGRWQNCHRFQAASRAAFRHGEYARGNALQDRFYDCMKSRWID